MAAHDHEPPALSDSHVVDRVPRRPGGTGSPPGRARSTRSAPAWTSPALDGQLYGEPLVVAGRRLRGHRERHRLRPVGHHRARWPGRPTWPRPVPAGSLPCGDISPTVGHHRHAGHRPGRGEIFVVADELVDGSPAHVLVGLHRIDGADRADPGRRPARRRSRGAAAAHRADARRRARSCSAWAGTTATAPPTGAGWSRCPKRAARRGSSPSTPAPARARARSGWAARPRSSTPRQHLGQRRQRLGVLGARTPTTTATRSSSCPRPCGSAVLRAATWATNNSQRSRHVHRARAARRRAGGAGREVPDRLPAQRGRTWVASAASRPRSTLACGDDIDGGVAVVGHDRLPALPERHHRRPGRHVPGRAPPAVELSAGGGPPIVAAGLVWTMGQNGELVRPDPDDRRGPSSRRRRHAGQPLLHPRRGRRTPPGPLGRPRGGLLGPRRAATSTTTTSPPSTQHGDPDPQTAPATTTSTSAPPEQGGSHTGIVVAAASVA